ncbi:hypothetical protein X975_18636, partial [Stegodyphus mimosarum]
MHLQNFRLAILLICIYVPLFIEGGCPSDFPIRVGTKCYRFQTDIYPNKDAKDTCQKLGGKMAVIEKTEVPKKIQDAIMSFASEKLSSSYFWIGLEMKDLSRTKALEDRDWTFHYDKEKIMQKNYKYWAEPPTDGSLTCAGVNSSWNFNIQAVDCGGPRIPVICMRKPDSDCKHDLKPYFEYGSYCIAAINGALEYNKIEGACHPDKVAPIKDDDMKKYVKLAARNSFLGGAVYIDFWDYGNSNFFSDGAVAAPKELWDEGEPREGYKCSGLGITSEGTLKLRTMSCDFYATSLCELISASDDKEED